MDAKPLKLATPPKVNDTKRHQHGFLGRRNQSPRPLQTNLTTATFTHEPDVPVNLRGKSNGPSDFDESQYEDLRERSPLSEEELKNVRHLVLHFNKFTSERDAEIARLQEQYHRMTREKEVMAKQLRKVQGTQQSEPASAVSLKAEEVFSARSSISNFSPLKSHTLDLRPTSAAIHLPSIDPMQLLEFQVRTRLLPVAILLSQKPLTAYSIKQAKQAARNAFHLVRSGSEYQSRAGKALIGRCCFYVGVCRLASEPLCANEEHPAKRWFITALDAKGSYVEGEWAEAWIRKLQRLTSKLGTRMSPTAANSPRSADSDRISGGLWNLVPNSVRLAVGAAQGGLVITKQEDLSSPSLSDHLQSPRVGGGIPSFTTWSTDESGDQRAYSQNSGSVHMEDSNHKDMPWSPDSIGHDSVIPVEQTKAITHEDDERDIPYSIHGGHVPIYDLKSTLPSSKGDFFSPGSIADHSSSGSSSRYMNEENELPSPATSPRSPTRSKSVAFSALERLSGVGDSPSPTSVIFDSLLSRRKLSTAANALAIATGIKIADELGLAEEGQSPFKSTFDADGSIL